MFPQRHAPHLSRTTGRNTALSPAQDRLLGMSVSAKSRGANGSGGKAANGMAMTGKDAKAEGPSDLERTLAAAAQDQRTVDDQRRSIAPLVDGMSFYDSVRYDDDRGSVTELFDPRWNLHPDPLVFSYIFTIRPGTVKGWGLHK